MRAIMRTIFQRCFALLELMSFLVNALQHLPKGVSARQMPGRTRELRRRCAPHGT